MYLDVILSLCRYTDPAESSKKIGHRPNLTLERLVNAVTAEDVTFGRLLEAGELAAVNKWRDAHFENIRSKRIGHNDLAKMTARFGGQPIGWPSREQVHHFLKLCTDLMSKVHEHFIGCPYMFDFNAYDAERDADKLINVLGGVRRAPRCRSDGRQTGMDDPTSRRIPPALRMKPMTSAAGTPGTAVMSSWPL
jgi:hypothetical protein